MRDWILIVVVVFRLAMAILHVHINIMYLLLGVYFWSVEIKQVLNLLSLPETGVENCNLLS